MDRLPAEQWRKRLGLERYRLLGDGYKRLDAAMAPAWHGKHHLLSWTASAHEPSLWQAITQAEPYPVKGLIVQHHNPLGGSGNAKRVEQALRSANLELLVVHGPVSVSDRPTGRLRPAGQSLARKAVLLDRLGLYGHCRRLRRGEPRGA